VRQQQVWTARSEVIDSGLRFRILQSESALSFRELFSLLAVNADFARWYSETLAGCSLEAFFWELPPLTTSNFDSDAEFVLIASSSLTGLSPQPGPFEAQFESQPNGDVISFQNLGGDAVLVVPRPVGPPEAYPHLAAFLRNAPATQILSLWAVAAQVVGEHLGPVPMWLSTAGLGVSWLHLRLDSRPKYYKFKPYRAAAQRVA